MPVVPTPGDYDDGEIAGMMIGKGNRSTRRKPAPLPLCPPRKHMLCPDANSGRRGGNPASKRLSYGTAKLPKHKGLQLTWVPGHECFEGNETVIQLAKFGSECPPIGLEPAGDT
jgi:hypothetical protein